MPEITNFLVVEDEKIISRLITEVLKKEGYTNFRVVDSFQEAVKAIELFPPDLVFTDINLVGNKTGVDLGHLLCGHYHIPFIYISSFSNPEIIESVKLTYPNAYLLKPFKPEDLIIAIKLALFNSRLPKGQRKANAEYFIKQGHAASSIPFNDILWLKADDNYAEIHTVNKEKHIVRSSLSSLHIEFPPKDFLRIHKSYVVNKNHISQWNAKWILVDNVKLPLGRTYKRQFE